MERADDLAIVEVPRIQLQVGDDVVHLEEEGMQGQREQEAGQRVALVDARCQREHVVFLLFGIGFSSASILNEMVFLSRPINLE
jgi:hypothetical protein